MNGSGPIVVIAAGALAAALLGFASARKSRRWHGLLLAATLACLGLIFGATGVENMSSIYLLGSFAIIVPWLLGGFIARQTQA